MNVHGIGGINYFFYLYYIMLFLINVLKNALVFHNRSLEEIKCNHIVILYCLKDFAGIISYGKKNKVQGLKHCSFHSSTVFMDIYV